MKSTDNVICQYPANPAGDRGFSSQNVLGQARNGELIAPAPARRPSFSLAAIAVVAALALTGCSDEEKPAPAGPSVSPSGRVSPPQTGERAEHIEGETVSQAPKPVNDGQVLLSVASRKGNAELPLTKEIGIGSLAVQVNCQGEGTLHITVKPVGLSFPLECVDEEVSSTYNEIRLKRARSEGSIQVTAPSTVLWALTAEQ
ncbi:hypothetical protein [Streptomyces sp. PpalLS-921]|uniref:hypothetical protein n=1 Tax=Streptomyces sp. PpalLS-921 TaxID=1839772 RepID=UPI00081DCE78|nr:hypothetical protein [Streptomyces sp. PpalLS-921]SCD36790.1 hypothetical protein GA0115249_10245 [Streptomyces sp. PpalLS-921]